jgi:hypothetical protein
VVAAFSCPFCFLRKAFFALLLSGSTHEFLTTLAFFSNQNLASRTDNFLDWSQIRKERLVSRHGSLRLIQPPRRLQGMGALKRLARPFGAGISDGKNYLSPEPLSHFRG